MRVIWTPRAIRQLTRLRAYIAKDSEASAAKVVATILNAVGLLTTQPSMGRVGRVLGTRELVVPRTPYVIPYRVRKDKIELHGVFHGSQRWPAKF